MFSTARHLGQIIIRLQTYNEVILEIKNNNLQIPESDIKFIDATNWQELFWYNSGGT